MAPRLGFEPRTFSLTASCSTVELPGNVQLLQIKSDRVNCTKISEERKIIDLQIEALELNQYASLDDNSSTEGYINPLQV